RPHLQSLCELPAGAGTVALHGGRAALGRGVRRQREHGSRRRLYRRRRVDRLCLSFWRHHAAREESRKRALRRAGRQQRRLSGYTPQRRSAVSSAVLAATGIAPCPGGSTQSSPGTSNLSEGVFDMRNHLSAILLSLTATVSATAAAHHLFIVPDSYRAAPGDVLTLGVHNADSFPDSESIASRFDGLELYAAGDSISVSVREDDKRLVGDARIDSAGHVFATAATAPAVIELDAEEFTDYLRE